MVKMVLGLGVLISDTKITPTQASKQGDKAGFSTGYFSRGIRG
jgi:hypothetical protein